VAVAVEEVLALALVVPQVAVLSVVSLNVSVGSAYTIAVTGMTTVELEFDEDDGVIVTVPLYAVSIARFDSTAGFTVITSGTGVAVRVPVTGSAPGVPPFSEMKNQFAGPVPTVGVAVKATPVW
jgi:hypothetical protein